MYEPLKLSGRLGHGTEKTTGLPVLRELDVNALNFCRFAIASLPETSSGNSGSSRVDNEKGKGKEKEGILVVPSLLDSEYVSCLPLLPNLSLSCKMLTETLGGRVPSPKSETTPFVIQLR